MAANLPPRALKYGPDRLCRKGSITENPKYPLVLVENHHRVYI
jgi:hypothetical protein